VSVPAEVFVICFAVPWTLTLGVLLVDCRCRHGRWPDPRRTPWRELRALAIDLLRRATVSIATEDQPLRRLAAFVVSLGLLVRGGIWSIAFAVGGEGSTDVNHGLCAVPIQGARTDTRLGIAVFELAVVGLGTQMIGGVVFGWPPGTETLVSAWLCSQALPLLADTPITFMNLAQHNTDMTRDSATGGGRE